MTDEPRKQTPGVYRRKVGDAMVTVINDGFLDIPMAILRGTERGDMEALMREHFHEGGPRLTVNAFVIETDRNTMLVDAGGGSTTVYSMGQLPHNLSAAGFKLSDFDTVLLTHIHPDHSSGLMDKAGKPLFPRADIIVHKDDFDFWSDTERRGRSAAAVPYTGSADDAGTAQAWCIAAARRTTHRCRNPGLRPALCHGAWRDRRGNDPRNGSLGRHVDTQQISWLAAGTHSPSKQ